MYCLWCKPAIRSAVLGRAVDLIAALVAAGPDAVVFLGLDIAGDLSQFEHHAHLRILRVEGQGRGISRAGWPNAPVKPTKAILAARPLAQGEETSVGKISSLCNVAAVLRIVQPLASIGSAPDVAKDILDVDLVVGVYSPSLGTLLVKAQLEPAISLVYAFLVHVVHTPCPDTEAPTVLVSERVAFALGGCQ